MSEEAILIDRPKTCLMCAHFRLRAGDPGYSEYTPGYDMSMECGKGMWEFNSMRTSEEEFRVMMCTAEKCEFYKYHKEV